jgi:opacity protein-like surface antigen
MAFAAGMMMALAGAARADEPGPYVGIGLGGNFLPDAPLRGGTVSNQATYDTGWATIGSVGLALDRNWRAEVEVGYRRNDVNSVRGGTGGGEANSLSALGNVLYDIDLGSGWTPYIGAGVGALRYRASGLRTSAGGLNDDDVVLAYQGIVGLSYTITPNSRFFVDYRYLHAEDPSVRDSAGNGLRTEYRSSTVLLGLRFTLAQPASGSR